MNLTDFQVGSYIKQAVDKLLPSVAFVYTAGSCTGENFYKAVDWYYTEWCGIKSV